MAERSYQQSFELVPAIAVAEDCRFFFVWRIQAVLSAKESGKAVDAGYHTVNTEQEGFSAVPNSEVFHLVSIDRISIRSFPPHKHGSHLHPLSNLVEYDLLRRRRRSQHLLLLPRGLPGRM
jgi:hypothetical protein